MKTMLVIAAVTGLAGAATSVDTTLFPEFRPIDAAAAGGRVAAVALDETVLAEAGPGQARLRIFDAKGGEVPYVLRTRRALKKTVEEVRWDAKLASFRSLKDNAAEIEIEQVADGRSPVAVVLHSPVQNFEKAVTVEGLDDGVTWSVLCSQVPIFDYSKFVDVRSVRVGFAESRCRRYRITVGNIQENQPSPIYTLARDVRGGATVGEQETRTFREVAFRVDRVEFVARQEVARAADAVRRDYPVRGLRVTADRKQRQTVVEFDGNGIPAVVFRFDTPAANFSRDAVLEGSEPILPDKASRWVTLAQRRLTRVRLGSQTHEELSIELSAAVWHERYRLTIRDRDNPPLDVQGIRVEGEIIEALFLPGDGAAYRLYYGGDGAVRKPEYDVGAVLGSPEMATAVDCGMGAAQPNGDYCAARGGISGRAVLIAAVLVMLAVLGWVLVRSVKGLEKQG